MTGRIVEVHQPHGNHVDTPGGFVRTSTLADRVPFDADELHGISLEDSIGRTVHFDVAHGGTGPRAVRVREQ
jgi:hypothetical protein